MQKATTPLSLFSLSNQRFVSFHSIKVEFTPCLQVSFFTRLNFPFYLLKSSLSLFPFLRSECKSREKFWTTKQNLQNRCLKRLTCWKAQLKNFTVFLRVNPEAQGMLRVKGTISRKRWIFMQSQGERRTPKPKLGIRFSQKPSKVNYCPTAWHKHLICKSQPTRNILYIGYIKSYTALYLHYTIYPLSYLFNYTTS